MKSFPQTSWGRGRSNLLSTGNPFGGFSPQIALTQDRTPHPTAPSSPFPEWQSHFSPIPGVQGAVRSQVLLLTHGGPTGQGVTSRVCPATTAVPTGWHHLPAGCNTLSLSRGLNINTARPGQSPECLGKGVISGESCAGKALPHCSVTFYQLQKSSLHHPPRLLITLLSSPAAFSTSQPALGCPAQGIFHTAQL